jgi:hypothetical protein
MKPPEMIEPGFPSPRILALMSASPHSVRERGPKLCPSPELRSYRPP